MMTTANPEVTFGTLNFYGPNDYEGIEFTIELIGSDGGLDWGTPEAIDVWLKSLKLDGDLVETIRHGNRLPKMQVRIVGDSADAVQAGEEALFAQCNQRNTLTWRPPDETAATTVFDVITAHLSPLFEDDLNERRLIAEYQLDITAEPWTRSVDEVVVAATPLGIAPDVPTLIDECTVTTGWTASDTLSVVSGQAVRCTKTSWTSTVDNVLWLERAGSVTITKNYIRAKVSSASADMVLIVGGVSYTAVAMYGGYLWFDVPTGTYSTIRIQWTRKGGPGKVVNDPLTLTVWSLYQTDVATIGTRRELAQVLDVYGAARAPGDLTVSHASNALGDVCLYTYPRALGDYNPSIAGFRTGGGAVTTDATLVSGGREPLSATPSYTIGQEYLPVGNFQIVARIRHNSTSPIDITWTASLSGTSASDTGTVKVSLAAANTWQIVPLDWVDLPPAAVRESSDKSVLFSLVGPAGAELDIAWLFHEDGDLTIVSAGSEKTATVESASGASDTGALYIGDYHPRGAWLAWGQHQLVPPQIGLYLVTTGTDDGAVSGRYYPRWFTRARF